MKTKSKIDWKWLIPKLIFVIPVLGAGLIGALSVFNNILTKQPLFPYDPASITLFLLTTWLGSEAAEILVNRIDDPVKRIVDRTIEEVLPHLHHTRVQITRADAYHELEKAYQTSTDSINIISFKDLRLREKDQHKRKYFQALKGRLEQYSTRPIIYRRLLWIPEHLDFIEEWGEFCNDIPSTEFAFLMPKEREETPILPCVIVDEKIVNFGWGYLGRPQLDEVNITLLQPEAVKAFMEYFTYLWHQSVILKKQNESLDKRMLADLKGHLSKSAVL